ncbi:MAG: sigma-70 family RNA polymerase sigma factor [Tepidisphaeraceae bacterium]|jgi:RNA polymerase sigma factor (sigma-70 family)
MTTLATPISPLPAAEMNDADLVSASRSGDRRAFGQIIRKYQAMVSGLIYAACGDLHRSEDVTQETFISAWKSLSGLRDASKLPGWLCQIARRRLADSARTKSANEVPFSQAFASGQEPAAPTAGSIGAALKAEEGELLWQALSRIPQPYRETLVLFYRQEQSTAQVAVATESSEAAVRQRLTRGREMLREEVAAMLERNLARTSPTPQFTMQVMAALPALAAQTAGIGAAAKGSAAAKGAGLLSIVFMAAAPILALASMVFGTWKDLHEAQSPRHRRITKVTWALIWADLITWVVVANYLLRFGTDHGWSTASLTWIMAIGAAWFSMAFFTIITFSKWKVDKVLREEGLREAPFPKLSFGVRLLATAPVVGVLMGWMVKLALEAGDHVSVELIVASIAAISAYLAYRLPRTQPDRVVLHTFETFGLCLLVKVIMLNWRLPQWIAIVNAGQTRGEVPMGAINLCAFVLFAWMAVLTVMSRRTKEE